MIEMNIDDVTIYESKHKIGDLVSPHRHPIPQILYAIDGRGELEMEGEVRLFRKDHAVVIPEQTDHAIRSLHNLTVLVIAFQPPAVLPLIPDELWRRHFSRPRLIQAAPWIADELRQTFRYMLYHQGGADEWSRWAVLSRLFEALLYLAKAGEAPPDQAKTAKSLKFREYIENHYFEIRSAADIAARFQVSVRYMDQTFKEQFQKTPVQYLSEVRVDKAKQLLLETDKEVISVCFEVGFETMSTFYRSFKQLTGMTPNQYRQSHGGAETK